MASAGMFPAVPVGSICQVRGLVVGRVSGAHVRHAGQFVEPVAIAGLVAVVPPVAAALASWPVVACDVAVTHHLDDGNVTRAEANRWCPAREEAVVDGRSVRETLPVVTDEDVVGHDGPRLGVAGENHVTCAKAGKRSCTGRQRRPDLRQDRSREDVDAPHLLEPCLNPGPI